MQTEFLTRSSHIALMVAALWLSYPDIAWSNATAVIQVDESALRYYASQNNRERVDAEIRRLKTLHPSWAPPNDLYKADNWINPERDLWELYASDQLSDLRQEISRRQQKDPQWQPSSDLLNKVAVKEARIRLIEASDGKRNGEVVRLVESQPLLLTIEDLDVLWRVAEAYSDTGAVADAADLYLLALGSGSVSADLKQATSQKAVAALPLDEASELLDKLRDRQKQGTLDFEIGPLARQIGQRWIAGYLEGNFTEQPPTHLVAALEDDPDNDPLMVSERLLAWYDRILGRHGEALRRFDDVLANGPNADATLGRILSLEALGRVGEAWSLARDMKEASPLIRTAFVRLTLYTVNGSGLAALTADDLKAFADDIREARDPAGASALAWFAFKANQMEAAAGWFSTALKWGGGSKDAEGHILSVEKLTNTHEAMKLQAAYVQRYPELAALRLKPAVVHKGGSGRPSSGGGSGIGPALKARERGDSRGCLKKLAALPKQGADAELLRGWCLLDLDRPEEAARSFDIAMRGKHQVAKDAAYGRSLALLRVGRTFDAIESAGQVPQTRVRRHELAAAALAQTATSAFDAGNYVEALEALNKRRAITREPRDLMLLRGWALYYTGDRQQAASLFRSLDQQLSTKETRSAVMQTSGIWGGAPVNGNR